MVAKDYTTLSNRRHNILYKLRKQGVVLNESEHLIEVPWDAGQEVIKAVKRVRRGYRFHVQFYIS